MSDLFTPRIEWYAPIKGVVTPSEIVHGEIISVRGGAKRDYLLAARNMLPGNLSPFVVSLNQELCEGLDVYVQSVLDQKAVVYRMGKVYGLPDFYPFVKGENKDGRIALQFSPPLDVMLEKVAEQVMGKVGQG